MTKFINDKYRKQRGGASVFLEISCSRCGVAILKYQKDGVGTLRRCYLNRIHHPKKYTGLHKEIGHIKQLANLVCDNCNNLIGTPMIYTDGRVAFRLKRGAFRKQKLRQ